MRRVFGSFASPYRTASSSSRCVTLVPPLPDAPPAPIAPDGSVGTASNTGTHASELPSSRPPAVAAHLGSNTFPRPLAQREQKTSASSSNAGGSQGSSRFVSAEVLVPFFPTFFVPFEVIQKDIGPEYSFEHIQKYFTENTKAVEIVKLRGTNFVRLHGFESGFDMRGVYDNGNERYRAFRPDPRHADEIWKKLPEDGKPLSLTAILARFSAEERLPAYMHKDEIFSLLFFSQMQHRFDFRFDGKAGGMVRRAAPGKVFTSVGTVWQQTPTPALLNDVVRILRPHTTLNVAALEQELHPRALEDLKTYYSRGGWNELVMMHPIHVGIDGFGDNRCLVSREEVKRRDNESKSIEQRIVEEKARPLVNRKQLRKLERSLLRARGYEIPEPSVLARLIVEFLPEGQFVPVAKFLTHIPEQYRQAFPVRQLQLFQKHKDVFTVIELRSPNHFFVARAGTPKPPGTLKSTFNEEEILWSMSSILNQTRTKTMSNSELQRTVPGGARDEIRRSYGSVALLASQYPEYFVVQQLRPDEDINEGSVKVTLVKMPAMPASSSSDDASSI